MIISAQIKNQSWAPKWWVWKSISRKADSKKDRKNLWIYCFFMVQWGISYRSMTWWGAWRPAWRRPTFESRRRTWPGWCLHRIRSWSGAGLGLSGSGGGRRSRRFRWRWPDFPARAAKKSGRRRMARCWCTDGNEHRPKQRKKYCSIRYQKTFTSLD